MATAIDIQGAAGRLMAGRRVMVTPHARADGDAIGSAVALVRVLRQRGATAVAMLHEPAPPPYAFLVEGEAVGVWAAAGAGEVTLENADLVVVVDTCARGQLGHVVAAIEGAGGFRLAIDHHRTRDDMVDEWLIDETAGACAQIITRVIDAAGWPIDARTAEMLFTGLATDTGWFRFSNADAAAFACAGRLIEAGARPNELYERLFLNEDLPRARLMGAILSSFRTAADGRLAVIRVTRAMLAACGATAAMTENLINEPQRVGRVVAAVMLVEPEGEGPIRVSLRSKRGVDVAAIAGQWGGGGHTRAAGVRIEGTIEAVEAKVVAAMEEGVLSLET